MFARVALINLGCPKNLVDAEVMSAHLLADGFELTSSPDDADVIVVNTCGFLEASAQEAVDTLLEAAERKKNGRCRAVIGVGCMTQRYGRQAAEAMPEVDGFLGTGQASELPGMIRSALSGRREVRIGSPSAGFESYGIRFQSTLPATAYVKVSEGCDRNCTFCAIPGIRGPMRSRTIGAILEEARRLVERGTRELILIGQDPTRYGVDLGAHQMVELLTRLDEIPDLKWIRLMYLFPDRHMEPILEAAAALPRVCAYVDMPFQHAAAPLLRAMNRPGSGQDNARMLQNLRRTWPDVTIRSTFIVGFPGETADHFDELLDFLKTTQLDWVGAFQYSPEDGTPAATMPNQVPPAVVAERYDRLMQTQQAITAARLSRWVGRETEVLITESRGDGWIGRAVNQAPDVDGEVHLTGGDFPVRPGDFVATVITAIHNYDLVGEGVRVTLPAAAYSNSLVDLTVIG